MSLDLKSVIGGGLLVAAGIFAAFYAWTHYDLGTLGRMGPGLFPMALGCLLAGLGLIILIGGLMRAGERPDLDPRPLVAITLAVALFALFVRHLGLAPAIVLMTVAAAVADGRLGPLGTLVLAGVLAGLAVGLFVLGFGMPLPIARWPF